MLRNGTRLVTSLAVLFPLLLNASESELVLRYDRPATDWMTEALPIGNGYMGAMFFGGYAEEQVQFSEGTLWAGGPQAHPDYHYGNREDAASYLEEVRTRIRSGDLEGAHEVANEHMTGVIHKNEGTKLDFGDYGAQQSMGDLFIGVEQQGEVSEYSRILDLSSAAGIIRYTAGTVHHTRTLFGSYPHHAMVYHFENDGEAGTQYTLRLETPHPVDRLSHTGNVVSMKGHLADNGLEFETRIVVETDGQFRAGENGQFVVTGANTLTLYHFANTAYKNDYPSYRGTDYVASNDAIQQGLTDLGYDAIWKAHLFDYRSLFNRVTLDLGPAPAPDATTDARLRAYQAGGEDTALEMLLFQYARYLTIAASRPGTMPMHLQGKWNNSTNPPWAADYHTNINLQMLYWPTEVANLSECHLPLLEYTASLVEPGRVTAKTHFGTRGWVVNTMNNAYGFTAPGWDFPWGFFPGGAGWLSQHLWEHYEYTGDVEFLRNEAYPVMIEAARFWLDYLQENADGNLVSIPSYSPEHGGISAGASMDHQIAWELLDNCVKAAAVLCFDDTLTNRSRYARDQLSKPTIGRWGQIQEWIEDVDDPTDQHRHISHLYALYPGDQINVSKTPEWAEAAKVTLNGRGDSGSGWSLAWKACFWARLREGDRAHTLLRNLLNLTGEKNVVMEKAGGVYQNLFCAHPPFQLDGNMGAAAAMAEMLLQSHAGEIHFLPALPAQWPDGAVKGLVVRGGHVVDIEWKNGTLTRATIHARSSTQVNIRYGDQSRSFVLTTGPNYLVESSFVETVYPELE